MAVSALNGVYAAFFSGKAAEAIAIFVFIDGKITGGDLEGTTFDGHIRAIDDHSFQAKVRVVLPPGGITIQGPETGDEGTHYETSFVLEDKFLEKDFVSIPTPLGPVNMRLQKIRELDLKC